MHTDLLHYYAAGVAAAEAYPDARGCSFRPETEQQLVVVYADMSMIVWDIQDVKKVSHCSCTLAHPTTAGNLVSSMHNSLHTAMSPDLANADFKLLDFFCMPCCLPMQITCLQTLAAHSSCIWDISPITAPVFSVAGFPQQQQPSRCATCAADGTVRFWNLSADAPPGTGRLLPGATGS